MRSRKGKYTVSALHDVDFDETPLPAASRPTKRDLEVWLSRHIEHRAQLPGGTKTVASRSRCACPTYLLECAFHTGTPLNVFDDVFQEKIIDAPPVVHKLTDVSLQLGHFSALPLQLNLWRFRAGSNKEGSLRKGLQEGERATTIIEKHHFGWWLDRLDYISTCVCVSSH